VQCIAMAHRGVGGSEEWVGLGFHLLWLLRRCLDRGFKNHVRYRRGAALSRCTTTNLLQRPEANTPSPPTPPPTPPHPKEDSSFKELLHRPEGLPCHLLRLPV